MNTLSTALLSLAQMSPGAKEAIIPIVIVFVVLVVFLPIVVIFATRYKKVGPNEVLVISGKLWRGKGKGYRTIRGGGVFVWPILERVDRISLNIMTLVVRTPEVYTVQGVPVIVDGVAQVKIDSDPASVDTAAEQFLGLSDQEIQTVALETLEGHLRAVLGTLTVEEIYKERDKFAQSVQAIATPDMRNMGMRIVSFTVKNIADKNGYLDALGKPRTAQVKRDAIIGQAEADRDATARSADANQAGQIARLAAETKIAEADRDYRMKVQEYEASVNQKRAEAELAYDIQRNITMQTSKAEEVKIQVVEREKLIDVQEKEIMRRERELDATVRKPAEAERYKIETLAEATSKKLDREAFGEGEAEKKRGFAHADVVRANGLAEAEARKAKGLAEADVIRAQGLAEAEAVKARGLAEAEANRKKAEAWKEYNEAAIAQIIIEKLPEIAEKIAAPLAKLDRITVVSTGDGAATGANKITKDVAQVIASLPPVVESLTGLSVSELIKRVPGVGGGPPKQ
ncbi:flotillin family protein [Candidatus Poribacteria bacterium]|nr:flotillin family protein [Candidatus Poribacteria bacterium]